MDNFYFNNNCNFVDVKRKEVKNFNSEDTLYLHIVKP